MYRLRSSYTPSAKYPSTITSFEYEDLSYSDQKRYILDIDTEEEEISDIESGIGILDLIGSAVSLLSSDDSSTSSSDSNSSNFDGFDGGDSGGAGAGGDW
jgi:uncharacterized membrane protein YgcG